METHTVITEKVSYTDLFLRTIAVLGLIAVLLLGAWGIIQLAIAIPNLFGSGSSLLTSSAKTETLAVSSAASITSGQTLQVTWTHGNESTNTQYSYAISYACVNGLSIAAPVPTGAYQTVACNTPFNYVNAAQHMTVIPTLTGTASTPLVFTITSTNLATGVITATGTSTTIVAPSATAKPATTIAKPAVSKPAATTYYPAATRPALYGYPDLATTITSITPGNGTTVVQFTIANVGTNIVNSGWTFSASLPINGAYTFASQPQQALYPGDKIVYNLSFSNTFGGTSTQYPSQYPSQYTSGYGYSTGTSYPASGYTCNGYNCTGSGYNTGYTTGYNYNTYPSQYNTGYAIGTVSITADPLNYILETNKGNNTASATTPIY